MKNWGSEVIPKEKWIDPNKEYMTRSGHRVIDLRIIMESNNSEVTFPVKGTIIVSEKPLKTRYQIWTLDGRADVLKEKGDDLRIVEETSIANVYDPEVDGF